MTRSEIGAYSAIGVGSALLIFGSTLVPSESHNLSTFLRELGFAGVIALIVIFTVEQFAKARHIAETNEFVQSIVNKMNKSMFHAIYDRNMPATIVNEIESVVLSSPIYRDRYELDYALSPIEGNGAIYGASIQSNYSLINSSSVEVRHKVQVFLERPVDDMHLNDCGISSAIIGTTQLTDEEIKSHQLLSDGHIIFEYPVVIPPGGSIDVFIVVNTVKLNLDMEIWTSRIPSTGFKITIRHPVTLLCNANSLHSKSLQEKVNNNSLKVWELPFGIFPHQGIVAWWKPSDQSPNNRLQGDAAKPRLFCKSRKNVPL